MEEFGLGEVIASGEITPDLYILNKRDLSLDINANWARNVNEVTALAGTNTIVLPGGGGSVGPGADRTAAQRGYGDAGGAGSGRCGPVDRRLPRGISLCLFHHRQSVV